jgi:hypothetical protein
MPLLEIGLIESRLHALNPTSELRGGPTPDVSLSRRE